MAQKYELGPRIKYESYERPLAPDSKAWRGLPPRFDYIKGHLQRLGIGPASTSIFTRNYVLAAEPDTILEIQKLYDLLEKTGDGAILNRWINSGSLKDERRGRHAVLNLFGIMDTLEELGKLKFKKSRTPVSNARLHFPTYLVISAEEFWDCVFRGKSLNTLGARQRAKLNKIATRAYRDRDRIEKYIRNKKNPQEKRNSVFGFLHFLVDSGLWESQADKEE